MKYRLLAPLAAFSLAAGVLAQAGAGTGVVQVHAASASAGTVVRAGAGQAVSARTFNFYSLPTEPQGAAPTAGSVRALPLLPLGRTKPSQASPAAPTQTQAPSAPTAPSRGKPSPAFDGMADSGTICGYFGTGCQPPDMALGVSPTRVFQGVNTSFALYDKTGTLLAGPVNFQNFFGVPNPTFKNGKPCDPAGPFLSDPRAFYDPNDGLFWAAAIQIEGALGVGAKCPLQSVVWIANFNPTSGVVNSYAFDTSLGTTNVNDYTQFGFNASTVAASFNMFNQAGTAYVYAESLFLDKHAMESGSPVTPTAFTNYSVGGVAVDTVQPVETETSASSDPGVLYLVNSYNMNGDPYGDNVGCYPNTCHGFAVWAYDPTTRTVTSSSLSAADAPYVVPNNADEPGCNQCIETIDSRITGTPVFSAAGGTGLISFGLGTNVNNGNPGGVAGILWGQIQPTLSGHTLTGSSLYQAGYINFAGDQAASFPALMPDGSGNLTMVLDSMGHALNPSIFVAHRSSGARLGTFGAPSLLKLGLTATTDSRWGDFEATSYDGSTVWVASQYSGANTDWSTWIAQQ